MDTESKYIQFVHEIAIAEAFGLLSFPTVKQKYPYNA